MKPRDAFQRNFTRLFKEKKITQQDVADAVNVSRSTVSTWLRGSAYPRADVIDRLHVYFGVPVSELLNDPDPSDPEADPYIHDVSDMMENISKEQKEQIVAIVRAVITHQTH